MRFYKKVVKSYCYVDVLVQSEHKGIFEKGIAELGFRVLQCTERGNPIIFWKTLRIF